MSSHSSLVDFLAFERFGKQIAFVEQSPYRTRKITYREVTEGTLRIAASLRALPIREGDRIILWGENSALWVMTFYACVLSRIVVVPIDASFSAAFVEKIRAITQAKLVCADQRLDAWRLLLEAKSRAFQIPDQAPDEKTLLEIIYTSGTTGEPKGVMITHGNILSNLIPIQEEYEKYKHYAIPFAPVGFVHLIPLSHLFGQIMGLFVPQMMAGKVIFSNPAPPNVIHAVKKNRASVVVCVPLELSMVSRYVTKWLHIEVPEKQRAGWFGVIGRWFRFRRVHREFGWKFWAFIVGGATLPVAEERFWNALGFAVVQGYGLTETAPSITITHPFKGIKQGSVGKKLPNLEVRLAEDGEILVRGPNVSPGYYLNEVATREVFKDGWLHTGDLGRFDEEGNLRLLGRKKEVIVTAEGLNVYPEDVEGVLNSDPEMQESAVVAHEANGRPIVHAVLVLKDGVSVESAAQSVNRANERLEAFQRISSFSLWPERALPRTTTGKLKRLLIAQGITDGGIQKKTAEDLVGRLLQQVESGMPQTSLNEQLGLSSLDRVEMLVELESRSGVTIDEGAFAQARTLSDVAKLLKEPSAPEKYYPYWKWPHWRALCWLRMLILHGLIFLIMPIRVKVKSSGVENLSNLQPPILFVANHQSILDVPVILKALPMSWRSWLAPAMGTGRTAIERYAAAFFFNTYPLPRTSIGLRDAMKHTGELADRGFCPIVFPEGVRTEDGKMLPFRAGIGVITKQTRLPVVPIAIQGAFEIWPVFANGPRRKGTVHVHFGPPFDFASKEPPQIVSELESWYE